MHRDSSTPQAVPVAARKMLPLENHAQDLFRNASLRICVARLILMMFLFLTGSVLRELWKCFSFHPSLQYSIVGCIGVAVRFEFAQLDKCSRKGDIPLIFDTTYDRPSKDDKLIE